MQSRLHHTSLSITVPCATPGRETFQVSMVTLSSFRGRWFSREHDWLVWVHMTEVEGVSEASVNLGKALNSIFHVYLNTWSVPRCSRRLLRGTGQGNKSTSCSLALLKLTPVDFLWKLTKKYFFVFLVNDSITKSNKYTV